jgi:hypothetical protein
VPVVEDPAEEILKLADTEQAIAKRDDRFAFALLIIAILALAAGATWIFQLNSGHPLFTLADILQP